MNQYYVVYKNKPLSGPMNKEDAERKLAHLSVLFRNLQVCLLPELTPSETAEAIAPPRKISS